MCVYVCVYAGVEKGVSVGTCTKVYIITYPPYHIQNEQGTTTTTGATPRRRSSTTARASTPPGGGSCRVSEPVFLGGVVDGVYVCVCAQSFGGVVGGLRMSGLVGGWVDGCPDLHPPYPITSYNTIDFFYTRSWADVGGGKSLQVGILLLYT